MGVQPGILVALLFFDAGQGVQDLTAGVVQTTDFLGDFPFDVGG